MRTASANQDDKKAAGESAAAVVEDGMIVGLGTGSTTAWAIRRLGSRVREEGLEILGVPTSYQAEALALESGIKLTMLSQN
jgi:ribose 5-phosphate isomerase A